METPCMLKKPKTALKKEEEEDRAEETTAEEMTEVETADQIVVVKEDHTKTKIITSQINGN